MKVLIINSWENDGGAARATKRLHKAYLKVGLDSTMLVMRKSTDDKTVISPFNRIETDYNKLLVNISALPILLYEKTRTKGTVFSPDFLAKDLSKIINEINPDIVHVSWINGGFMNLETLLKIDKPVLITMHDNWLFTGGCHVMRSCELYMEGCGNCQILGSNKKKDLSWRVVNKKKKIFDKIEKLQIISLSKWMTNCASKSFLLKDKNIVNIPNLIDTEIYKPYESKKIARDILNLPSSKKLILFGAMHAKDDENKGYYNLKNALSLLNAKDIELVVFGSSNNEKINEDYEINFIGNVYDDNTLKLLYSSADVVVVPSFQENLSNVIMESLSCGTPVVAFEIGGNSDMIEHKINGYLAKPYSSDDLAKGIEFILEEKDIDLGENARDKILKEFSEKVVVPKYLSLYESMI